MTKAFQASGAGASVVADTPRAAAQKFFSIWPTKRKCTVTSGEIDGHFFTVKYGRASAGEWPRSWRDVTKKTIADLPATAD